MVLTTRRTVSCNADATCCFSEARGVVIFRGPRRHNESQTLCEHRGKIEISGTHLRRGLP